MTILFFTRLFYPHIGGVEKHVFEVGKRLVLRGYKVIVVTEEIGEDIQETPLKKTNTAGGMTILRIPLRKQGWFKKFFIWLWFLRNRKLIESADIIHAHDVFFWFLPFKVFYPEKPVFTTFHGHEGKYPPSQKAKIVRKISEVLSRGTICIGDYIRKWYDARPDFVSYGGVDSVESETEKHPSKKKKILFVGRLDKDMGVLVYLEALKILKSLGIDFEFEACGDGVYRKYLEAFGIVHGYVLNTAQYVREADIIFASSYLSILEGLFHKRAVFSVHENPLKEDYLKLAPFSQFIQIHNNPHRLADGIESYFLHPEESDGIVEEGYRFAREQTWDAAVEMYLKLWKV